MKKNIIALCVIAFCAGGVLAYLMVRFKSNPAVTMTPANPASSGTVSETATNNRLAQLSTAGQAFARSNNLGQAAIDNLLIMEREGKRRGVWENHLADAVILERGYWNFNPSNGASYFGTPFTHNGLACPFGLDFEMTNTFQLPVSLPKNYCVVYVMRYVNAYDWDWYLAPASFGFVFSVEDTHTLSGNYFFADHNQLWSTLGRDHTNWVYGSTNYSSATGKLNYKDIRDNGVNSVIPATGEPLVMVAAYNGDGGYKAYKNTTQAVFYNAGNTNFAVGPMNNYPTGPMNLLTFGSNQAAAFDLAPNFPTAYNVNIKTNYGADGTVTLPTGRAYSLFSSQAYTFVGGPDDISITAGTNTSSTTNMPGS